MTTPPLCPANPSFASKQAGCSSYLSDEIPLSQPLPEALCARPVRSLRPHGLLHKYSCPANLKDFGTLAVQGDSALDKPLFITADNEIVEGLDRWVYAQHCGIGELKCKVLSLTPEQTVIWILKNHQPSAGLNAFSRVLIALELEPWLKCRAKANQQHGGEWKQLSKLAEASHIDVREQLAKFAGVGAANVDKVKLVWTKADHSLIDALKMGEVSIHRAWCWVKASRDGGKALLWERRKARQMQTTLRNQSKKLRRTQSSAIDGLNQMRAGLRQLLQHQGEGAEIGAKVMQMFSGMGDEDHDASFAAAAA